MAKLTLNGPQGVKLHLDSTQIFPDDPGNGTPALVEWRGETGTYWCSADTGECGDRMLPESICRWLNSDKVVDQVEAFMNEHG